MTGENQRESAFFGKVSKNYTFGELSVPVHVETERKGEASGFVKDNIIQ